MKPVSISFLRGIIRNSNSTFNSSTDADVQQMAIRTRETAFTAVKMFQSAYSETDADIARQLLADALTFCRLNGIETARNSGDSDSTWNRIKREFGDGKQQLITDAHGNVTLGEFRIKSGYRHTATGTVHASANPHVMHNYKPDAHGSKPVSVPRGNPNMEVASVQLPMGTDAKGKTVYVAVEFLNDNSARYARKNEALTAEQLFARADAMHTAAKRTLAGLPKHESTWNEQQRKTARSARAAITRARKMRNHASAIQHAARVASVTEHGNIDNGLLVPCSGFEYMTQGKADAAAEQNQHAARIAADNMYCAAAMDVQNRVNNPRAWKKQHADERTRTR